VSLISRGIVGVPRICTFLTEPVLCAWCVRIASHGSAWAGNGSLCSCLPLTVIESVLPFTARR
jgi:hypothetical protein